MSLPDEAKIRAVTQHAAEIEQKLRGHFHAVREELETRGLSDHEIDTALLNALCRLMTQTLTHIALLLSLKEIPSEEKIDEVLPELMKKIADDVFEATQTILSKHSGRSIVHITKTMGGGNP